MRRAIPFLLAAGLLAACAAPPASAPPRDDQQAKAFSTYLSARFAAGEHDLGAAARYYGESLKDDPANTDLLALSFFYSATSGDLSAAGRYAAHVVQVAPDDRAARLALAATAFKRGDYADVRKQLSLSAKGPFTVLTVALFDGWAAAAMKDQAGVDKDLAALAAQKGAENVAAFHSGLVADFMGDNTAAEAGYKSALSGGATPRVLDAYGRMLERAGRVADAAALYHAHDGEIGFAAVVVPGLARIAATANDPKTPKPEPLVRTPADGAAEALFGIAASLSDAENADVSVLYLRMVLYLRPDFPLAHILIADRFERLRKFDDAIVSYRAIDPASPYYRMAQQQSALDEAQLGHADIAIADFRKLTASDSGDVESWTALGDALRAHQRDGEAVEAYDHAVLALGTPRAKDWPLFYARATVKDHMHDWAAAETDIGIALRLSPAQPELLNYLGYSWVDRGVRIPEALAMLEKARGLKPYDGYIVDSVGWAYFKLGRYDDATAALEEAVLLVPGDPTINEHFGDALWRAGKPIDARFQWNHALTFADDSTNKTEIEQKLKTGLSG